MTVRAGPGAPPVPAVCLVILDGWGLAPAGPGNAVELARTPVFDELCVTADHGNSDQMLEPDGSPNTAHSLNPVPILLTADAGAAPRSRGPGRRRSDHAGAAGGRSAVRDDGKVTA